MWRKRWVAKALFQTFISRLPFAQEINHGFQLTFGALRNPRHYSIDNTLKMINRLGELGISVKDSTVVEVGTGWSLASALTCSVYAPAKVVTYDIYRHLRQRIYESAAEELVERQWGQFGPNLPAKPFDTEAIRLNVNDVATSRNIEYRAPHDAGETGLEDGSVDLVYSLAVLEHVPIQIIDGLIAEWSRILKKGGLMYHYIQPGDHSKKKGASGVQFLQYSGRTWNTFLNNDLNYQSRVRDSQYREIFTRHGFEIIHHEREIDESAVEDLKSMDLAPEFDGMDPQDLATRYSWFVCRKA